MDDLRGISFPESIDMRAPVEGDLNNPQKQHRKPGRKIKDDPRSEKVSCRLTQEEKEEGERYCEKHGMTEAKLLRASYLATILQPPDERLQKMVEALLPLDGENLSANRKVAIRAAAKNILQHSRLALLLILFGCAMQPVISKGFWFVYEGGKSLIMDDQTVCIYHTESKEPGCEVIQKKWILPTDAPKNPLLNQTLPALRPSR